MSQAFRDMQRLLFCFVLPSLINSCTNIELNEIEGSHQRYLGFISLEVPKAENALTAIRAENLGVAMTNGLALGWHVSERITVPLTEQSANNPEAPCTLVVIIRSKAEAEYLKELITQLKGVNLCYVPFTE